MEKLKTENMSFFDSELGKPELEHLENLLESNHLSLVGINGEKVDLPECLYKILRQVTPLLAQGKGVTLIPRDHYLTTQQAAEILNISRPYLYTLLDKEEIPYTQIGTHRRIKVEDILKYKTKRDSDRRQALCELIGTSQELGFYEQEAKTGE